MPIHIRSRNKRKIHTKYEYISETAYHKPLDAAHYSNTEGIKFEYKEGKQNQGRMIITREEMGPE